MANEKRLIDANALQFEPDPWGGMNGVICLGRSGGKTMATVQAALKCMIDNAPTVDAVEVVRCKDCRWFNKRGYEEDNEHEEDLALHMGFCLHWRRGTQACCFCSYGERREGE